jgi:hypothetical protein
MSEISYRDVLALLDKQFREYDNKISKEGTFCPGTKENIVKYYGEQFYDDLCKEYKGRKQGYSDLLQVLNNIKYMDTKDLELLIKTG